MAHRCKEDAKVRADAATAGEKLAAVAWPVVIFKVSMLKDAPNTLVKGGIGLVARRDYRAKIKTSSKKAMCRKAG